MKKWIALFAALALMCGGALAEEAAETAETEEIAEVAEAAETAEAEEIAETEETDEAAEVAEAEEIAETEETAEGEAVAAITANIGDIVTFGSYEQDNDESNGAEPIEWIVLDVQDGKALLLTRYAIDARNYHPGMRETSYPTWEKSDIRAWLGSTFIETAFTQEEIAAIATVTLSNPSYKKYNWGGPDTEDRVFLLSRDEVEQYFPTYESRMVIPTAYALAQGAWESSTYDIDGVKTTWWWLRTPGYYRSCAASVRTRGTITSNRVYDETGSLRPAIWVNLAEAE